MATLKVLPSGGDWRVTVNGQTVSNHRLKRRAVGRANREAQPGDTLQIHRSDGTVQKTKTM
jgi:hypothetical protein